MTTNNEKNEIEEIVRKKNINKMAGWIIECGDDDAAAFDEIGLRGVKFNKFLLGGGNIPMLSKRSALAICACLTALYPTLAWPRTLAQVTSNVFTAKFADLSSDEKTITIRKNVMTKSRKSLSGWCGFIAATEYTSAPYRLKYSRKTSEYRYFTRVDRC